MNASCFYQKDADLLIYMDDKLIITPNQEAIHNPEMEFKNSFDIPSEGELSDFLGALINYTVDSKFVLTQQQLIPSMLHDLNLSADSMICLTPSTKGFEPTCLQYFLGLSIIYWKVIPP
jgi:hypothetical protein